MARVNIDNAEQLADAHFEVDPLPLLEPSLLSAAHIQYYVLTTGMMETFDHDALKSASYEVPIRGEVIHWTEDRKRVVRTITDVDDTLELAPNSITFVEVEPTFRLPRYIAFRFNLRIHHVHRGLLLGTGPLVDPGFRGKILIPLHNLTATPYDLDLKKALIWVEFTKTSYGRGPVLGAAYKEKRFPEGAWYRKALVYIQNANGGFPILSSIPEAVQASAKRAEDAQAASTKAAGSLRAIQTFGLLALLTAVGGVGAIVFSALGISGSIRQDLTHYQSDSSYRLGSLEAKLTESAKVDASRVALGKEMAELKDAVEALRRQVENSTSRNVAGPSVPAPRKQGRPGRAKRRVH